MWNSDSAIISCGPELCKRVSANEYNHQNQNPLLVTGPRAIDNIKSVSCMAASINLNGFDVYILSGEVQNYKYSICHGTHLADVYCVAGRHMLSGTGQVHRQ